MPSAEPAPTTLHTVRSGFAMPCPTGTASAVQEYALTQDDVLSLGMVCGGSVQVLYQLLTPAMLPFFTALATAVQTAKTNLWLIRGIRAGQVESMCAADSAVALAQTGIALPPAALGRLARWQPEPAPDGLRYLVEPVQLATHTYLFGCGHVAQCVAPLLSQLDFSPIVYDDRPEFASPALFPTAFQVVCAPYQDAANLSITAEDEIVIMTRGHVNDILTLSVALRTPAYYIGLIGSRSKIAHTQGMLLSQGFTVQDFARVHTPIGVPILAETPMEIAVSVAAEMIRCRAEHARLADAMDAPGMPEKH